MNVRNAAASAAATLIRQLRRTGAAIAAVRGGAAMHAGTDAARGGTRWFSVSSTSVTMVVAGSSNRRLYDGVNCMLAAGRLD